MQHRSNGFLRALATSLLLTILCGTAFAQPQSDAYRQLNSMVEDLRIGAFGTLSGGDANGDGVVTVADIFHLINFLFAGGAAPAQGSTITWKGPWVGTTTYELQDAVSFSGSSYIAIAASTGQQPDLNPASWDLMAERANFSGAAAGGDLSGTYPNPSVAMVGGQTAGNLASGAAAANASTHLNTVGTIVRRDRDGSFSAGTITGDLIGNATSATDFSGDLAGEVRGTQGATVVASVGGQSAENVAAATSRVLTEQNPRLNPLQIATLRWYEASQNGVEFAAGSNPEGVVFDGANIWVANAQSNNVTKLRASDGLVVGTFPVGMVPRNVAFDGVNVWVANTGSNSVTKLRASDGVQQPGSPFAVGLQPRGIAYDGVHIWVANSFNNTVTKLRASDGVQPTGSPFPAGSGPFGIAFDGTNIWVVNQAGGAVTKLRASDGVQPTGSPFAVGLQPFGVAFDGANIWVTNNGSNSVTKLRASDGVQQPGSPFAVGLQPRGVAFDGTNIWVANTGSNNVTKLRASDGTFLGAFTVGMLPIGVAFDGTNIWVSNNIGTVSKL